MYPAGEVASETMPTISVQTPVSAGANEMSEQNIGLAATPILQLPQFLLDKYRRPKPARSSVDNAGPLNGTSHAQDAKTTFQSRCQIPDSENVNRLTDIFKPLHERDIELHDANTIPTASVADETKPDSQTTGTDQPSPRRQRRDIKISAMPWALNVNWKVNHKSNIFEDDTDRALAKGMLEGGHHNASTRLVGQQTFWDHPVRYLPNSSEKNLYRTAIIDFIPVGTDYKNVLDQIRTGALESIQLIGPVGNANDFMTARIVFNYELPAVDLCIQDRRRGTYINGQKVRVWHVPQPTYPKNPDLEHDIFEASYTRMLLIDNVSDEVLNLLGDKLAEPIKAGLVIEVGKAHDGVPMIEFTCVVEAVKAMRQLVIDPDFGGAVFDFETDPCDVRC